MSLEHDVVVVGAGPNGLAAAILLAQSGCSVCVLEAKGSPGGATRTEELTLPGFRHDMCSAIHPMAFASPFFRTLPLGDHGLEWIHPAAPLAHPFDDGSVALLERSFEATGETLGPDGEAWASLFRPFTEDWEGLLEFLMGPLQLPGQPIRLARFGLLALRSATGLARSRFEDEAARGLFGGIAAHSFLRLDQSPSAAVGLVLGLVAHVSGWPLPRGGAGRIADALVAHLESLGGEVVTGRPVLSLDDLPPARAYLFNLTTRQLLAVAGDRLPPRYRKRLERYRYGPAAFKVDWALREPIPWRAPACARAGTVHLGATLEEMAESEAAANEGRHAERPFVLLAQHTLFDPSRAPPGRHTAWGYCHVPHGSTWDMTERIESQLERFAPGFRDVVLERHVMRPADLEARNGNLVGGDINGGLQDLRQLFTRPVARLIPYETPEEAFYICSSSTPPGGGVHGMSGYYAALAALRRSFGRDTLRAFRYLPVERRPLRASR